MDSDDQWTTVARKAGDHLVSTNGVPHFVFVVVVVVVVVVIFSLCYDLAGFSVFEADCSVGHQR